MKAASKYWIPRPDRMRAADRRHTRMLVGLGFKSGKRNPQTYAKRLIRSRAWNRAHRDRMRAANARYRAKYKATFGTTSNHAKGLYVMTMFPERLEKKRRAANAAREALLRIQKMSVRRRSRRPLTLGV